MNTAPLDTADADGAIQNVRVLVEALDPEKAALVIGWLWESPHQALRLDPPNRR